MIDKINSMYVTAVNVCKTAKGILNSQQQH
jgi:hypothetical protein